MMPFQKAMNRTVGSKVYENRVYIHKHKHQDSKDNNNKKT